MLDTSSSMLSRLGG